MKKLLFVLLVAVLPIISNAQDTSLVNRVNEMLKLTQLKDLEKVMDYTYKKLFTIVPREALINAMKSVYETEEFTVELDSVKIHTIFPVFVINDTSYVKVKHTMLMKMVYKGTYDPADKESKQFMVSLMQEKFGEGNVRFDAAANSLNIFMVPDMVGIKTKTSTWTFANLNEDNPTMLSMLFNKQVLDKLGAFK